MLPRLSIDSNRFGRAEIMVDFIIFFLQSFNYYNFISYLPPYIIIIKYNIDNFHGFFFAQTDGITFIWIPLCQFERIKQYENDNF